MRARLSLATVAGIESGFAADPAAWMTGDERARADRIGSTLRRRQFVAGHWLARCLGAEVAGGDAAAWRFIEVDGIRRVAHDRFGERFVSIAHCAERIACAVSAVPVGIDLELERKPRDYVALARTIMSRDEHERFAREPADRHAELFLQRWTLSEAHGKRSGEGLRLERARALDPRPSDPANADAVVWSIAGGKLALCAATGAAAAVDGASGLPPPTHWRFASGAP